MNYFIGSLYGNKAAYEAVKEKLNLKKTDTLWILGDAMDGESCDPIECVEMLEDIARQPNIKFVIGDHEFAHIMCYISQENKESYDSWKDYSLSLTQPSYEMIEFLENEISEDLRDALFSYLIQNCEISHLIKIGDNFFYITHGFPCRYTGNMTSWQFQTVANTPDDIDFLPAIKTDPCAKEFLPHLTTDNTFVICSNALPKGIYQGEGSIYHGKGVFVLNTDICENQIPVLGIDAAGYFFKNIVF